MSANASTFSEKLLKKLDEKEYRSAFMADRVRTWLALQIRALREQKGREWSQAELGVKMGKPQSTVSRLEDPDYGKVTLNTLFEVADAFDVPLLAKFVGWDEWLTAMADVSTKAAEKQSFNLGSLRDARAKEEASSQWRWTGPDIRAVSGASDMQAIMAALQSVRALYIPFHAHVSEHPGKDANSVLNARDEQNRATVQATTLAAGLPPLEQASWAA